MTARTAILLGVASMILLPFMGMIGALFKVQHWPLAWVWLTVAWLFSTIMMIVVASKVLRYPGFKDFLDR
jgi:hypothetical protein